MALAITKGRRSSTRSDRKNPPASAKIAKPQAGLSDVALHGSGSLAEVVHPVEVVGAPERHPARDEALGLGACAREGDGRRYDGKRDEDGGEYELWIHRFHSWRGFCHRESEKRENQLHPQKGEADRRECGKAHRDDANHEEQGGDGEDEG